MRKKLLFIFMLTFAIGIFAACSSTTTTTSGQSTTTTTTPPPTTTTTVELPTKVSTHAEFMAASRDTLLKIEGKVIVKSALRDSGDLYYFLQNGKGGYQLFTNEDDCKLDLNKSYSIVGTKDSYNGQQQLKDIIDVKEVANIQADVNDISALKFNLKADMLEYFGSYVSIDELYFKSYKVGTDENIATTTKAFSVNFTKDGKDLELRVDPVYAGDEFVGIRNFVKDLSANTLVNVKGIMSLFGYNVSQEKPQLMAVKASDLVLAPMSAEDKVDSALFSVNLKAVNLVDVNKLPLVTSVANNDSVISWVSSNPAVIANNGDVFRIANDIKVELTMTVTNQEVTKNKVFNVLVLGNAVNAQVVYSNDFEYSGETEGDYGQSGIKQGYAFNGPVYFGKTDTFGWNLHEALHGKSNADIVNGTWAIRTKSITDGGKIETNNALENIAFVDFYAKNYGADPNAKIKAAYKLEGTEEWVYVDLDYETTSEAQLFRVYFNLTGSAKFRFEFEQVTGKRVCVDDVKFYSNL